MRSPLFFKTTFSFVKNLFPDRSCCSWQLCKHPEHALVHFPCALGALLHWVHLSGALCALFTTENDCSLLGCCWIQKYASQKLKDLTGIACNRGQIGSFWRQPYFWTHVFSGVFSHIRKCSAANLAYLHNNISYSLHSFNSYSSWTIFEAKHPHAFPPSTSLSLALFKQKLFKQNNICGDNLSYIYCRGSSCPYCWGSQCPCCRGSSYPCCWMRVVVPKL